MENKTILEERILAVKEAGKEIQKIYKEGFSISYKEDDSPVTNADLASNQIIRNHLSKFKDIAWLSEESQDDFTGGTFHHPLPCPHGGILHGHRGQSRGIRLR